MKDTFKDVHLDTRRSLLIISFIYLMSQGFLLILTGRWWDDWPMCCADSEILTEWARQAALIPGEWLWPIERSMSERCHFTLVFLLMYFIAVLLYFSLKYSGFFSNKACLGITILYVIFPCFDARVFLCVMLYVWCLFFFFLATYCVIRSTLARRLGARVFMRAVSMVLFLISFWMESLLVFYAVPFIYLYANEVRKRKRGEIKFKLLLKTIPTMFKYIDYILLPFAFFIWKQVKYPVYGSYASYNTISIKSMAAAIIHMPKNLFVSVVNIFGTDKWGWVYCLVLLIGILILLFATGPQKEVEVGLKEEKHSCVYIMVGIIVLILSVFPYMTVRERELITVATTGRDSILMPLGFAIILYYVIDALRMQKRFKIFIYVQTVLICAIHFNIWYMSYQKDWYYQEAWGAQIAGIEEIRDNNTFLVVEKNPGIIGGHAAYSFNWNAKRTFGDEERLFMPWPGLSVLEREDMQFVQGQYGFSDYDLNDTTIDGVVESTCTINVKDTLHLKFDEIFHQDRYEERVRHAASLRYIPISPEQSEQIMEEFKNGTLTDNEVYVIVGK